MGSLGGGKQNMTKKYELEEDHIIFNSRVLYRIRATKDTIFAKKGDKGGYIESERNLSQDGQCWIADDARVFDNALVKNDAIVYQRATILDQATVGDCARVSGWAWIHDYARIADVANVNGRADIRGDVLIYESAKVTDHAKLFGECEVGGRGTIGGCAYINAHARFVGDYNIREQKDYLVIGPIGQMGNYLTVITGTGMAVIGNFEGSLNELEREARERNQKDCLDLLPGIRNIVERRQKEMKEE